MPRTVQLTTDGDLDVSNGRAHMLTGGRAVAQLLRNRLLSFRGEWFMGRRRGVPMWEDVLVHAPNGSVIEQIYFSIIRTTTGVTGINKLDLDFDPVTRKMLVYPDVLTTEGTLTAAEIMPGG